MKALLPLVAIVSTFSSLSLANVSIEFSDTGLGVISDGFLNSSGVETTGMLWALVIDTGNDGFDGIGSDTYQAFDVSSRGYLSVLGTPTDDYFTFGTNDFTGIAPPFLTADASGIGGGVGSIIDMLDINVVGESLTGNNVGIIWFESNTANQGDNFGFLDTTLQMPTDGATVDWSATVSALTPGSADLVVAVPEPAHFAVLAGIFGLGFVLWRRR